MTRVGVFAALAAIIAAVGGAVAWQTETTTTTVIAAGPTPSVESPSTTVVSGGAVALTLDGASLFQSKGCATCHDGPTSTAMIGGFPSLAGAPSWAGARRAPMSAADYVAESIRSPSAFTSPAFTGGVGPTDGMPDLHLTQPEIDALVTYLLQG